MKNTTIPSVTVRNLVLKTGDPKICFYKFGNVNMMREGFGADMHPSVRTHERMGREMAEILKKEWEKHQ